MFHVELSFRSRTARTLLLLAFAGLDLSLSGCSKPVPDPENLDPIYADLQAQEKGTASELEAEKKSLADAKSKLSTYEPRSSDLKTAQREISRHLRKITALEQMDQYYLIRIEQRKTFDHKDYLKAWNKKESWPDPKEFADYKEVRKLQTASLNWQDRVPKLTRNLKGGEQKPAAKKEEKPAEKAE